jgi:hypothetical protein
MAKSIPFFEFIGGVYLSDWFCDEIDYKYRAFGYLLTCCLCNYGVDFSSPMSAAEKKIVLSV